MMKSISMHPIGKVFSTRKLIEDDHWDGEKVYIELDNAQFTVEALVGLTDFSHVEVLFHMDRVDPKKVEKTARHPRNNSAWPNPDISSDFRCDFRFIHLGATLRGWRGIFSLRQPALRLPQSKIPLHPLPDCES